MCLFSHILVLLDCSPVDDAIIDKIMPLAVCGKAAVTMVHVVHSHTIDQDRALKDKTEQCMAARVRQLERASIPAHALMLSGEPEAELVKEINSGHYDLVALATHGHKLFSDLLLGSVSEHLKHEVSVPLLMVRGKTG